MHIPIWINQGETGLELVAVVSCSRRRRRVQHSASSQGSLGGD